MLHYNMEFMQAAIFVSGILKLIMVRNTTSILKTISQLYLDSVYLTLKFI
jgi:hypothetical protein